MNNHINDDKERQRALDITTSFIVQAPAGSGKTELLTQRFLVLLAHVKQPEEILAITFTKKSAAEMRARILQALNHALNEPEPTIPHQKKTWQLAKKVLDRSHQFKWNLLDNPNRIRTQTIDSFNAYLTKQLPILSHFGATPDIIDDPTILYRAAVQEFLSHLEENVAWADSIAQLLVHMDNDLNKLESLLINMLAKRDQWLPYITTNNPTLRKQLEAHLTSITTDLLSLLYEIFPKEHTQELLYLANLAALNLKNDNLTSNIQHCSDLAQLPDHNIHHRDIWLGLSELLLTKEFEWRKKIDKNIGFKAPSQSKHPEEKAFLSHTKQRMTKLIESLSTHDDLRMAFEDLNRSPLGYYQENQWQTLHALQQMLQVVVAQLKLVFQQHGKIDYIESAQAALLAMGSEDSPTDMILALDYQIQHILIDEFQDTSHSQYRLVEKLLSGWEYQDGRTLFLVGDPMQSIYRFREAEVGLFIRSRKNGIGRIKLEPLTLSVNFRSTAGIVNWVNAHFCKVFPSFEDIGMGAVSYSPSIANAGTETTAEAVHLHPCLDRDKNGLADGMIQLIQEIKTTKPTETTAILVRSRNHLRAIIPALKKAGIPYRAIDIDPLDSRPVIQDLMALTRALLHPADRIAWLSILRAPWCGLSLSDLFIIANHFPDVNLWDRLNSKDVITKISPDGQTRLSRILPILQAKLADRYRYSLCLWLESSWLMLGGPASVTEESALDDATAYFQLLQKLDEGGELADFNALNTAVSRLFASPNHEADQSVQIMTIHNSKGLEFDNVILPHLERKSPHDEKQLLLWMERPRPGDSSALIMAPIHAVGATNDSIYDYIKRQHAMKSQYENGRLLYVAATRAKKQLHLFFLLQSDSKITHDVIKPIHSSLLEKLWAPIKPYVLKQLKEQSIQTVDFPILAANSEQKTYIRRLSLDWQHPIKEVCYQIANHKKQTGFRLPEVNPKYIGTIIHQILQQISDKGVAWWENQLDENKYTYLKTQLTQLGMLPNALAAAIATIEKAIHNTLKDDRGQWIIHPHPAALSEFRLTAVIDEEIRSLIIDRTFIDKDGTRWIIDFKTSTPDKKELADFLCTEQEKYASQMKYYLHAMKSFENQPIKLGLYFPCIPAWIEWQDS